MTRAEALLCRAFAALLPPAAAEMFLADRDIALQEWGGIPPVYAAGVVVAWLSLAALAALLGVLVVAVGWRLGAL